MAKKAKAPEARIDTDEKVDEALAAMEAELRAEREVAAEQAPEPEPMPEPVVYDAPAEEKPSAEGLRGSASKAIDWLDKILPGNRNAAIGAAVGLIFALLFFVIGFWRMLACAIFVFAGIAVGQLLDGDPKIIRAIKRFIDRPDRD